MEQPAQDTTQGAPLAPDDGTYTPSPPAERRRRGNVMSFMVLVVGLAIIALLAASRLEPTVVADALGEPLITFGSPDAPHQLVAFISPTCSHCARFELESGPELYQRAERGELFYTIYPLTLTEGTEEDTRAFFCAHEGGALPSYSVLHYQDYFIVKGSSLQQLAEQAGLDKEAFTTCVRAARTEREVQRSQAWADELGVQLTPTFYLKGPGETQWREVKGNRGEELLTWLAGT